MTTIAQQIARSLDTMRRCEGHATNPSRAPQVEAPDGTDMTQEHWQDMAGSHRSIIEKLVKNELPSGRGWDCGTDFDFDRSTPNRLVFSGDYHHMNESGVYDGWTEHTIIVTPSLAFGLNVRVTGRDCNQIKEYLADIFSDALEKSTE